MLSAEPAVTRTYTVACRMWVTACVSMWAFDWEFEWAFDWAFDWAARRACRARWNACNVCWCRERVY